MYGSYTRDVLIKLSTNTNTKNRRYNNTSRYYNTYYTSRLLSDMWHLYSFFLLPSYAGMVYVCHCKYCKCTTTYRFVRTRDIYIANYCIELLYLKMKTLNTLILFTEYSHKPQATRHKATVQ